MGGSAAARSRPRDLAGRAARTGHRHRGWAALGIADRVQAPAGGDTVQPGPQGRAAGETIQAAPRRGQGLLEQVVGVGDRAEHPVAVQVQLAPVRVGEEGERVLIAGPGALERETVHPRIVSGGSGLRPAPTVPFGARTVSQLAEDQPQEVTMTEEQLVKTDQLVQPTTRP